MCIDAVVSCTASAIGEVFGFAASRFVLTKGIISIRRELEACISVLANKRFGEWAGNSIGFQCSLVLANPVASMIGSLVWTCISETVQATVTIIAEATGLVRRKTGVIRSMILTSIRVCSITMGFFIRRVIINYAVPVSVVSAEVVMKTVLPFFVGHSLARYAFTTLISLSGAAYVPLAVAIIAEVIAFVAQQVLSISINALCDTYVKN